MPPKQTLSMFPIADSSHAKELLDIGFLQYADSSLVNSLETELISSFNIYDENSVKIAHIDAEELAEFSFEYFIPTLKTMLAKRGITLSVQKLNDNESNMDILINGDTISLYSKQDLNNDLFWDSAPRNFFKKVNDLLKVEDSKEQFYLLYGGNDLHTLLLTDREFEIISDYHKDNPKEQPYKP